MLERKEKLKSIIANCCNNSAIIYNGCHSIKLLEKTGTIIYIENSRMLDVCEYLIPDYNMLIDKPIIIELSNEGFIKYCESHNYRDEYCLSIMLLNIKE